VGRVTNPNEKLGAGTAGVTRAVGLVVAGAEDPQGIADDLNNGNRTGADSPEEGGGTGEGPENPTAVGRGTTPTVATRPPAVTDMLSLAFEVACFCVSAAFFLAFSRSFSASFLLFSAASSCSAFRFALASASFRRRLSANSCRFFRSAASRTAASRSADNSLSKTDGSVGRKVFY
jgi:hypothetical protein